MLSPEHPYTDPYDNFDCQGDERTEYLVGEQKALMCGIVNAWYLTGYSEFSHTYEVLGVEREETVELGGLVWMSRPDILVRRKSDGSLFIINLKTTKRADDRWTAQWPIDQQTLSEVVAVEHRLNQDREEAALIKLSGVIILGLVKGEQLEYPKGSGKWYHNNPLIWAWHNESGKAHPRGEWTARYEWADDEGNHRLGKGWVKREVWIHYEGGVAAWVAHLAQVDPVILHNHILQLPPIMRDERQVQAWKRAVTSQELAIRIRRGALENAHPGGIDALFPMSTSAGNCLWPGKCDFFQICHENADPEDEQLYMPRVLNHPGEII